MRHSTSSSSRSALSPAKLLALALAALPAASFAQTQITNGTGNFIANSAGTYFLNNGDTRSHTGEVFTVGASSGSFVVNINGILANTATNRAIRTTTGAAAITLDIGTTGIIRAIGDDAIQARNAGAFNLTNAGTIYSGPNIAVNPSGALPSGQALDFDNHTVGGTIVNQATGLIRADGHDAVRLGDNMSLTNYGTIRGNSVVNDSPANNVFNTAPLSTSVTETFSASEGVSFEGNFNSSLDNHGTISGARHGVESAEAATGITITNHATGTIIGRNGSGIGFDSTTTDASAIVIHNHGLIRGDFAGDGNVIDRTGTLSPTQDGDGDGIDIDGAATITNHATGIIRSTGANGFDSGGRANNSEGISIGGGIINNHGLIEGATRGILVNNDSNVNGSRSGSTATTITNHATGSIEGLDGFAIRLENKTGTALDNDTLVNDGTIIGRGSIPDPSAIVLRQNGLADPNSTGTLDGVAYTGTGSARFIRGDGAAIQMGEGNDILTNTGTITGNTGRAINMEGGNDTVNLNGGTVTGSINGGSGTDTLNLGAGVSNASAIQNFETIGVASGTGTLSGVVSGGALTKTGAGTLVLSNANTYSGGTTLSGGTLVAGHNSALSDGTVTVNTGTTLRLDSGITISNSVTLAGGSLILAGGSYTPTLAAAASYATLAPPTSSFIGGNADTTATILAGTTGAIRTVTTSFGDTSAATNDNVRISDVFSFSGSGSDIFVLELTVASGVDNSSYLGWLNGSGLWVNAVDGNIGGPGVSALTAFAGNFASSGVLANSDYLGSWGYDVTGGKVWAVINHNSDFAAIPEPSSFAAFAAIATLGFAASRRRRPAVKIAG